VSVQKADDRRPAKAPALSPAELASLVIARLVDRESVAPVSLVRVSDLIKNFANFLAVSGVEWAGAIQHAQAAAFVRSLTRSGNEPSLATMHLRRSALRIFFREAKALGVLAVDPTHDIALVPRSYRDLRPLTDEEVERCRSFAEGMVCELGYALAWSLAEATARVAELAGIRAREIDLERGRVWIAGSASTEARWAGLTDWGAERLKRVLSTKPAADRLVLQPGKAGSRSFFHELVSSTLRRAGLGEAPGVRPNSVPAWRGAKALADGAPIDEVALLLGIRSLDRAASFIGFQWRGER